MVYEFERTVFKNVVFFATEEGTLLSLHAPWLSATFLLSFDTAAKLLCDFMSRKLAMADSASMDTL